jgi:hypothetical protein
LSTGSSPSSARIGAPSPLSGYRVIPGSSPGTELISAATTKTGLTVRCELDTGQYPSGIVVSDAEMAPSTSNAPNSTATGTTPSHPIPTPKLRGYFLTDP